MTWKEAAIQVLQNFGDPMHCLLYTSDAADERSSVDLGGRRIIKKKNIARQGVWRIINNNKKYNKNQ